MTRFARAKGSKASNERREEDPTPWHVMRQQLADQLANKSQVDNNYDSLKALKNKVLGYNVKSTQEVWSEFGDVKPRTSIKPKKDEKKESTNQEKNVTNKFKLSDISDNIISNEVNNCIPKIKSSNTYTVIDKKNHKEKIVSTPKVKRKGIHASINNSDDTSIVANEVPLKPLSTKIQKHKNTKSAEPKRKKCIGKGNNFVENNDTGVDHSNFIVNKNKGKIQESSRKPQKEKIYKQRTNTEFCGEVIADGEQSDCQPSQNVIPTQTINKPKLKRKGIQDSINNYNETSTVANEMPLKQLSTKIQKHKSTKSAETKRKKCIEKDNNFVENNDNGVDHSHFVVNKKKRKIQESSMKPQKQKIYKQRTNTEFHGEAIAEGEQSDCQPSQSIIPSQTISKSQKSLDTQLLVKAEDNTQMWSKTHTGKNNWKNHKSKNVQTIIANGRKIKIVQYEAFWIKEDDATKLKQLKKVLKGQNIPNDKVKALMKLERRRAEKALSREKTNVCYHCRKFGHKVSECPDINEGEMSKSGICYKCGSLEHSHYECKVTQSQNFRYAVCFVCKEQGHIARQCPLNPQGQYPKGGCCHLCGEITHLRKDCPKAVEEKPSNAITLEKIKGDQLEDLSGIEPINKKNTGVIKHKVVKF